MEILWAILAIVVLVLLWAKREGKKQSVAPRAVGRAEPKVKPGNDLTRLLNRTDVWLMDTETTGLGQRAEVIEVVAIDTTGALRLSVLSMPDGRIPTAASDIHGLTRKHLKKLDAKPWPEVHDEVKTGLEGASTVLAWNAGFDVRMLNQTVKRHDLEDIKVEIGDLLEAYRILRPGGSHSLASAMKREGARWSGKAHRAEADCRAMLAVLRRIG